MLMIARIDGRVAPEVVLDADQGETLAVRNVASLVPPYQPGSGYHGTSAAIEFAVRTLRVRRVAATGHASCGGTRALRADRAGGVGAAGTDPGGDFVARWMDIVAPAAGPACEGVDPSRDRRAAEFAAIRQSLADLRTLPWLARAEREGALSLHGVRFDVADGGPSVLDGGRGDFAPLPDRRPGGRAPIGRSVARNVLLGGVLGDSGVGLRPRSSGSRAPRGRAAPGDGDEEPRLGPSRPATGRT